MRNQKFNEHKQEFDHGQGLIEYVLILVGVVVIVILSLTLTGETVKSTYCRVSSSLGGEACGCVFAFNDAKSLDEWSGNNKDDYFTVENGLACMTGNGKSRVFLNPCTKSYGSDDIVVTATYMTVSDAGKGNMGVDILFRALDEKNHYKFIYNADSNIVRFWKVVYGKWINLGTAKVPSAWRNEALNFRIEVRGSNFKAYRDDQFLLEANDSMFTEGQVGLRNKPGSKTCLDELSVELLP